jgi:glycosyltransferase involved in cell wall biosynthesis
MNIALYHNLPSGGASRATYEMVKELAKRGHNIDEYCPTTADRQFLPLDDYVRETFLFPFQPKGVFPHRLPLLAPYLTAIRLIIDLATLSNLNQKIAKIISNKTYDLVFVQDCQLIHNPDLVHFLKIPTIAYCHHGGSAQLPIKIEQSSSDATLLNKIKYYYYILPRRLYPAIRQTRETQNIRGAHTVITNSQFACESLYRFYGVSGKVCYLGVDTAKFRPFPDEARQPFLLTVGAIHYLKGYRFMLEALGKLPKAQRLPLTIAANSAEPSEQAILEQRAKELEISLTIRHIYDDKELVKLYNQACLFVYTPIMEPWGLTPVEAMACGTPVLAVAEGGVRESVINGETGVLVERDASVFADALVELLNNEEERKRLGQSGVQHVRANFTWGKTVDRLETIFAQVGQT